MKNMVGYEELLSMLLSGLAKYDILNKNTCKLMNEINPNFTYKNHRS